MQVNLKQSEIERALKMYIASQGISLQGRDVEISFTAGRRGSGVSADMQISEDPEPEIPVHPVNRSGILRGVDQYAAQSSVTVAEDVNDSPGKAEEEETQEEEAVPPKTGDSLFGSG